MYILYDDDAYNIDAVNDYLIDIGDNPEEISDNEKYNIIREWLDFDFDDLQAVFDRADNFNAYVIFGTIQRWNGYFDGYTTAESLSGVIYKAVGGCGTCFLKVFIDSHGNLIIKVYHHDGTNTLTVKGVNIPTSLSDNVCCRLWDCIRGQDCFKKSDTRYFRSIGKKIIQEAGRWF